MYSLISLITHSYSAHVISKSPLCGSQSAGLNVVANGVVDERGVVLRVDSSSNTGSSIVLCARRKRGGVESINSLGIYK